MVDKARQWQEARGPFSHDWLKNSFLLALGSFVNSLSGKGFAVEEALPGLREDLAQWRERRQELVCLLDAFETAMSPATLFDSPPLSRLDPATRQWLEPLTHRLWWQGRKKSELVTEVRAALKSADEAFERLEAVLETAELKTAGLNSMGAKPETETLEPAATKVYAAFQRLAEAIHRLPSNVEVV